MVRYKFVDRLRQHFRFREKHCYFVVNMIKGFNVCCKDCKDCHICRLRHRNVKNAQKSSISVRLLSLLRLEMRSERKP